jgi:hypothetical protein
MDETLGSHSDEYEKSIFCGVAPFSLVDIDQRYLRIYLVYLMMLYQYLRLKSVK